MCGKDAGRDVQPIRRPRGYLQGSHFLNTKVTDFLRSSDIKYRISPSGSHKSTGMVEVSNKLLEGVLRKSGPIDDSDLRLSKGTQSLNGRVITHLGFSPTNILIGSPSSLAAVDAGLEGGRVRLHLQRLLANGRSGNLF